MLRILVFVMVFFCADATANLSLAAAEPVRLKIIYSSFTGAYTPLWLAVDDQLGRKYNLDFEASTPVERGRISFC